MGRVVSRSLCSTHTACGSDCGNAYFRRSQGGGNVRKVAAVFGAAGVEDSMVLPRIIMLESFIYGSAFDVHAPADIFEVPEEYEVAIPALRRARAAWADSVSSEDTEVSAPNPFAEDPFRIGLQALLGDLK